MSNWVDFPPEILEKILNNVQDFNTMETARLVNSNWKEEMDKINARKDFFTWIKWQPSRTLSTPSVDLFPKVHWSNFGLPNQSICVPSPSTSFQLYVGDCFENQLCTSMQSQNFWNTYGSTTRNIVVNYYQTLSFHHGFLSRVPNIEGIRFMVLECEEDTDIPFLRANRPPPLPQLKHLEIWDVVPNNTQLWMAAVQWFLEAYAPKLVSLKLVSDSTTSFSSFLDVEVGREVSQLSFENLQVLFLSNVPTSFYQCFSYLPQLTHLSIMESSLILGNPSSMRLEILVTLFQFIDKFSDTLVKLKLDVNISELTNQQESIIFDRRSPPKLFPRLTVFGYNYPVGRLQSSLMKKWFLGRFPALQKLQFFKYPFDPYETVEEENDGWLFGGIKALFRMTGFYTEEVMNDEELMKRFVEKECYLKVVPTLQTISVRKFKREKVWEDFELLTFKRDDM